MGLRSRGECVRPPCHGYVFVIQQHTEVRPGLPRPRHGHLPNSPHGLYRRRKIVTLRMHSCSHRYTETLTCRLTVTCGNNSDLSVVCCAQESRSTQFVRECPVRRLCLLAKAAYPESRAARRDDFHADERTRAPPRVRTGRLPPPPSHDPPHPPRAPSPRHQ